MGNLARIGSDVTLGPVDCIEDDSPDTTTLGDEDADLPSPGQARFYLVEFNDGSASGFGTETAPGPRIPAGGGCPSD